MLNHRTVMILLCLVAVAPSQAAETRKPRFIYYPVKGQSAKAIREDILRGGPKIGGNAVFSFTIPAIKITTKTKATQGQCSYKSYRISSVFTFVLPQLTSDKGLLQQTKANWHGFAIYLKDHENLHRKIWLKCLSDFESQAMSLSGKDCDRLENEATRVFERAKLACLEEDRRLDFYYAKEALKTPFLREAMAREAPTK